MTGVDQRKELAPSVKQLRLQLKIMISIIMFSILPVKYTVSDSVEDLLSKSDKTDGTPSLPSSDSQQQRNVSDHPLHVPTLTAFPVA